MVPEFCQSMDFAGHTIAGGACRAIYDFQTLITGAAAIVAAWFAGAPVWRQLRNSDLQTQILHRDTLASRLREAEDCVVRFKKDIEEPLRRAQEATSDPSGEPIEIGAEKAFGLEQMIAGRLDWYLVKLEGTEAARVETAKVALRTALHELTETLAEVHWPAHNDQSGEDYAISDADWAETLRKARDGRQLATEKVAAASIAARRLMATQATAASALRRQIARLDRSIAR